MKYPGKHISFLIFSLLLCHITSAQIIQPRYWIEFTDKNDSPYSIDQPERFLSQRALARRTRQQISVTEEDLPVNPQYLDSLEGLGLQFVNVSKWFNGASFSCEDTVLIDTLERISFVAGRPLLIRPIYTQEKLVGNKFNDIQEKYASSDTVDYGFSYRQTGMLKGDSLHNCGYEGQNILITLLDAGFSNADSISSLQHIYLDNRIIAMRDFVKDGQDIYDAHSHGTVVFSIIGGLIPSYLHGTATQADFALVRTEEHSASFNENIIEEYNWISGAEFADSLGTDIISSSLGYSLFDDPSQDHSWEDMDGKTTPISIAATMAASKGILVVTSAGNSAGPPWFKITAPADADSILAIGAVNSSEIITDFSSRGPSFDGRVKPDICAMGYKNIAQHPDGNLTYCTGTSCSAPVISGLAACLWQAHPEATNEQVIEAILKSSDRYLHPDSVYGYGIPDFSLADFILTTLTRSNPPDLISFRLFPNPVSDHFNLEILRNENASAKKCRISYIDLMGRIAMTEEVTLNDRYTMYQSPALHMLPTGIYLLRITYESLAYNVPFMKIR